jgi:hypothetical protein
VGPILGGGLRAGHTRAAPAEEDVLASSSWTIGCCLWLVVVTSVYTVLRLFRTERRRYGEVFNPVALADSPWRS